MKQLIDCITEAKNPNYTLNEKDEKILFVILEYFIRDFERREDLIKFARKMKGYGTHNFSETQLGKFLVSTWEDVKGTKFDRDLPY